VYDPNDAVQDDWRAAFVAGRCRRGLVRKISGRRRARSDVLVYTTPAFAKDTEVTGPVSLDLYVGSSAVDHGLHGDARGCLAETGFAQNLTSGILRIALPGMRRRNQSWPIRARHIASRWTCGRPAMCFLTGHKLRLEVSSSNFPRFDRNLNTGEEQARATRMVKATKRDLPRTRRIPRR